MRSRVLAVSPLAGLRGRSLGEVEVLAQSVAVTAPSAAAATTPALVASTAGLGTLYSYVIAIAIIGLLTLSMRQFTMRLAAPGSLYTFVAQGLGARPAVVAGAGLVVGYAALSMAATVLAGWYGLGFLARIGVPHTGSPVAVVAALVLVGSLVTTCLVRGIGVSTRVALLVEGGAVLLIVAILLVVLTGGLDTVTLSRAPDLGAVLGARGSSLPGILHGAGLAVASFIGFESAIALGAEARRPLRSIPRAITRTVVAVSSIYLLAVVVLLLTLGTSLGRVGGTPLVALAADSGSSWLPALLDLAVACSGFACAAGAATALARLLFAMAREHGDHRYLGHAHHRTKAPDRALLAAMVVVVGVPLVLVLSGGGLGDLFRVLVTIATVGYLLGYVVMCAALPAFLRRIGEPSPAADLVALFGALALTGLLVALVVPGSSAWLASSVVTGTVVLAGLALHERFRTHHAYDASRIGLYAAPILSDLHPSHR